MKTRYLLPCIALSALLMSAVPGCQFFATPDTPAVQLTPEQQQARRETTVRVASSIAVKGTLIALDDKDAASTAKVINTVAGDILAITANDTLDLAGIHDVAVKHIAEISATPKQKLIANSVVDSITLIVQSNLPPAPTTQPATTNVNNIRLVRAAAQGAQDATLIFLP